MNDLPIDIAKKLEFLPVIPFEDAQHFHEIIFSNDFNDIFTYYSKHFMPEIIKSKPEIYQRISLYMTLTNQDREFTEQTDDVIYRRPVPTIEEFLDGNRFLGLQNQNMYPYWREQLCEIFKPNSPINRVLWSGATGTGKCEDKNTIIPTPMGYRRVGDIKEGEYLWSKNGKPTKVLKIYERGIMDMYYVNFNDGTSTKCGLDHLWEIIDYSKGNEIKIRDTKWLLETKLRKNARKDGSGQLYKYGINYCQPVEYEKKEYFIEPYLLGVLIGDGTICKSTDTAIITNHIFDKEIIDKCEQLLPEEYKINCIKNNNGTCAYSITRKDETITKVGFLYYIEKLGLRHTSKYKFIPNEYLIGSIDQRIELLRGLMDTDGSIIIRKSKNNYNTIRFGTISKQLAEDVAELVRSLGGRAKISIYERKNNINHKNLEYNVSINMELNPFFLKRKAELFKPRLIKKKIISVTKADSVDARCFYVDADDHLYLTKHYIVTHNTVTARKAVIYSLYKLLCLRYPRATLNVEPGSTLACFILSVTQKTAYQTNFEPFVRILDGMPCFQRVRNVSAFENFDLENPDCPFCFYVDKSNMTIVFKDNFILTLGSQISNTVGYDVVISAADEVNELGVGPGMELLNSIDGRVQGRFAGSPFIAQHVMSSARSTDSVTREYVKKWQSDPGFLYLHPMRFEVKSTADFTSTTTFPVQIGNGSIPSTIINNEKIIEEINNNTYIPPAGCEIVHVPEMYKQLFEADITQSIQDVLGIDTNDNNMVFRDTSLLIDNTLISEIELEANVKDNINLMNLLPIDNLFEKSLNGRWYFKRAPNSQRFCFTANTKVQLLNNQSKTMLELEEDYNNGISNWVYTWSNTGWQIGKIIFAGKTSTTKQIYKITLDNEKVIECTSNHKFLLRNNTYCEAKNLRIGDSLMPLYKRSSKIRSYKAKTYEQIKDNNTNKWIWTHQLSAEIYKENFELAKEKAKQNKTFVVRHHKDFDASNNYPDNIIWMEKNEHFTLHSIKGQDHLTKLWKNDEFRRKMHKISSENGKKNGKKDMLNKWHGENNKEWRDKIKPIQAENGKRSFIQYNKSEKHRKKAKEVLKTARKNPEFNKKIVIGKIRTTMLYLIEHNIPVTEETWDSISQKEFKARISLKTALKYMGSFENILKLLPEYNHKIKNIEITDVGK